jgi:hypothetical protein
MGAVKELWWVIIMIGGPALCVVLWEQYKKRQARKSSDVMYTTFKWDAFGNVIKTGQISHEDVLSIQRQKRLDDHTFKTVEEYRDDVC